MADKTRKHFEVLVVGAGPAGLAAATAAAGSGTVGILDDNPALGGQIWRGDSSNWTEKLRRAGVETLCGLHVVHHDLKSPYLFAEGRGTLFEIGFSKLILATGARERFLPFPGWTLPNVMAAGGLQAMVKSGLPIAGKRVVVAGTGPLLLAVAAYLRRHGAKVLAICEQASWNALTTFGLGLFRQPGKLAQAWTLQHELRGVSFWPNCWPVRARGVDALETVVLSRNGQRLEISCDYLAYGFHLVANTELAALLGCRIQNDYVAVNDSQQTSVPGVFCAGEPTGIGGLERSLLEGQIAGLAAAGRDDQTLKRKWRKAQGFAQKLERTFTLRPELKALPDDTTIVCRCEDVTHARLSQYRSWRDAKNQTRCGMGPCQGRVCGPAVQFLYGWHPESVRPPIFPITVQNLAAIARQPIPTGGYQ
jgi:D-hydroxyproline dehydrogenase subunit alpha